MWTNRQRRLLAVPRNKYQLFNPLSAEEYAALEADIAKRGVLVAVEHDQQGNILDGHHRVEIAKKLGKKYKIVTRKFKTEQEKKEHVIKLNLARRHLDPLRWGQAFAKLLDIQSVRRGQGVRNDRSTSATVAEVASDVGVSERTARHRLKLLDSFESLPLRERKNVEKGNKTLKNALVDAHRNRHKARAKRLANNSRLPSGVKVVHGDFRQKIRSLKDDSITLILTDPPYDKPSLPLYGDLAKMAADKLKPGGHLITYVGHYAIPRVLELMCPHIRFWWMLGMRNTHEVVLMRGVNVYIQWLPLLWFVKGKRQSGKMVLDFVNFEKPEKQYDDWQKGTELPEYYINKLTEPGDLVVDPFCGTGTTLVAAVRNGRRAWGCDIDSEKVQISKGRISAARKSMFSKG